SPNTCVPIEPEVICQKGLGSFTRRAYKPDGRSKSFQGNTMKTAILVFAMVMMAANLQARPTIARVIVAPASGANPLDTGAASQPAAQPQQINERQQGQAAAEPARAGQANRTVT